MAAVIEKFFYQLQKSEFWIPCFTSDGRENHGAIIAMILCVWLLAILLLGGFHRVIGVTDAIIAVSVTLLAYVMSIGISYWANDPLGVGYLKLRQNSFQEAARNFNSEHQGKGVQMEIGRYGAYIGLRFDSPIRDLGVMISQYKKLYNERKEKEKEQLQNHQEEEIF